MPLVIQTYRTACSTVAQPPGFGDFLRGCIALYQLSKKLGFELEIDFSRHPLSQYLNQAGSNKYNEAAEVHEFFNQNNAALIPFLIELPRDSKCLVTTHCVPASKVTESCRRFLKKCISPSKSMKMILKEISHQLGKDYCVVHLRMGDHAIGGKAVAVPAVDACFRNVLVPEWGNRILVLSDNSVIKEYLSERYGVMFIPNIPVHLGQCGTLELPQGGVRDTIIDFFVMARSRKVYQYSVYPWGSGFSDMCSLIFQLPLVKILETL